MKKDTYFCILLYFSLSVLIFLDQLYPVYLLFRIATRSLSQVVKTETWGCILLFDAYMVVRVVILYCDILGFPW
jgi:hypothetical protein